MRTNDQYFKPGDKVMRVGSESSNPMQGYDGSIPQFGQVYCIEDFWEGPQFNVVMLVGFGGFRRDAWGRPIGWRAINFRSVEEVKICLKAVQKAETPSLANAAVSHAGEAPPSK